MYLFLYLKITIFTGVYIRRIIKHVCSSFNISLDQIYTITTDNGTNMLKAIRILSSEYEDCKILEENQESDNESNDNDIYLEHSEEDIENEPNGALDILEDIDISDVNSDFPNNILTGKFLKLMIIMIIIFIINDYLLDLTSKLSHSSKFFPTFRNVSTF